MVYQNYFHIKNSTPFSSPNEEQDRSACASLIRQIETIQSRKKTIETNIRTFEREVERSKDSIELLEREKTSENHQEIDLDIEAIRQGFSYLKNQIASEKQELQRLRDRLNRLRQEYNTSNCRRFTPLRF